jgi:hypothetical protein
VTAVGTQAFDLTECSRRSYANTRSIPIEFAVIAVVRAVTVSLADIKSPEVILLRGSKVR